MDIETITKLLDAGYSKEEIDKLTNGDAQETDGAGSETEPTAEIAGDAKKNDAQSIGTGVDFGAAIENLTNTVTTLSETVKAMQEKNIKGASGGKADNKTVDDVMKSFVDSL